MILGPNGKLSKRDGAKYGFPVFAATWKDPKSGEVTEGFREKGFLPQAFVNLLAMLGWNDGTEQEIFSLEELVEKFSIEKVHKGGAKFDYEKAKWYNHEWIKKTEVDSLIPEVKNVLEAKGIMTTDDAFLAKIIQLVKERCSLLPDFYEQSYFFFKAPTEWDTIAIKVKWNEDKKTFFHTYTRALTGISDWSAPSLEALLKQLSEQAGIKPGELQLPLRIMLVGGKFGPPVFYIAEVLGKHETIDRINNALTEFGDLR